MKKKLNFMGIMFSTLLLGQLQVTTPIEIEPIGSNLNLGNTIVLNVCTMPNSYPCALLPNTRCVNDENGQYHCECNDGYVKDDNGICQALCYNVNCTIGSTCNENIIDGIAICLSNSDSVEEKGVLLCDDYNLGGVCYLYRSNVTITDLGFKPKSIRPIGNWEFYLPLTYENKIKDFGMISSTEYIVNLNESDYSMSIENIEWVRESFIIQTSNYETFLEINGSNHPYVEIKYFDNYDYQLKFREVLEVNKKEKIYWVFLE